MSNVLTPGPDAKAEPYYAIMETNKSGKTTGNVWTFGGRIMLFKDEKHAKALLESLTQTDDGSYALRGVTKEHLDHIRKLSESHKIPVFVINSIADDGTVEAVPLKDA